MKLAPVTKERFDNYIAEYPAKLHASYSEIGDPPSTRYFDTVTKECVACVVWNYGPSGDVPEYRIPQSHR